MSVFDFDRKEAVRRTRGFIPNREIDRTFESALPAAAQNSRTHFGLTGAIELHTALAARIAATGGRGGTRSVSLCSFHRMKVTKTAPGAKRVALIYKKTDTRPYSCPNNTVRPFGSTASSLPV